jgi:hypothetical protein
MDLIGERLGQAPVARIDLDLDARMLGQQVGAALGVDRGPVVHAARAYAPAYRVRPWLSLTTVGLRVLLLACRR